MTFVGGLLFPEEPVALSDGSCLLVEGGETYDVPVDGFPLWTTL